MHLIHLKDNVLMQAQANLC